MIFNESEYIENDVYFDNQMMEKGFVNDTSVMTNFEEYFQCRKSREDSALIKRLSTEFPEIDSISHI